MMALKPASLPQMLSSQILPSHQATLIFTHFHFQFSLFKNLQKAPLTFCHSWPPLVLSNALCKSSFELTGLTNQTVASLATVFFLTQASRPCRCSSLEHPLSTKVPSGPADIISCKACRLPHHPDWLPITFVDVKEQTPSVTSHMRGLL